ncbi:NADase-type glycan-binding domain-containing protein [Cohaesibacter celericrescens]|uniref:NAD glycohydrolase translocation F5/8 type C domain-containing protein n=1 Tax=Cohaesibacter celericrescens TaxID=2067669 RepID=A0A2N5XT39_9HYPH|nr:hypothetical protein [Cohaesibacter celericrescens]PLW77659.1 hypothetical protein C0081_10200 [Cohaesibacter celericrescens]
MKAYSVFHFLLPFGVVYFLLVWCPIAFAQGPDCDRIYFGTELVDDVTYCASSVLPNSKVATYRPGNLSGWEANTHHAWCEGKHGNGVGEWFEFTARPSTTIRKMIFFNGYQKSRKSFSQNARARDITIRTDSGLVLNRRLLDRWGKQVINLDGWHQISSIRVTIRSVYPGTKYSDLCLSGFGVDFEELRELEFQQMQ